MDESSQNLPKIEYTKAQRIEKLKELGETIGIWNISRTDIAKQFGVSRRTIHSDIQCIFKRGIDKDSVEKAIVNIDNLNRQLLKGLQAEFIKAKTSRDKAHIANALLNTQDKITDFLERYGFKEKVADITEVKGSSINLIIHGKAEQYPDIKLPSSKPETE